MCRNFGLTLRNENINDLKWENGFLGSLRLFRGELHQDNFFEMMECLRTLQNELVKPTIDQTIVSDIVSIIHLTRVWASPNGMLGSNHLLTEEQTKHLLAWVDIIESCFMFLLEDVPEAAFTDYEDYLKDQYF